MKSKPYSVPPAPKIAIPAAPRVVFYVRVSTDQQTVEPQLHELRAAARQRGWKPLDTITDVISGSKASRAGLNRLLRMVEAREVDVIMAVKLDRLARSLANFVQLTEMLDRYGVALVIPGQGIDTSDANPCGHLMRNLLAVVAQFERSLIQERTKAGLAVARTRGKVIGQPNPNMPPPDQRGRIVAAWRKRTGGDNYAELAEALGGVNVSTAWREAKKWPEPFPEAEVVDAMPAVMELD